MRTNLKLFRVKNNLSQLQMAEKLNCTRATYSSIECGSRDGRQSFWKGLQSAFAIPDANMWELMQNDE